MVGCNLCCFCSDLPIFVIDCTGPDAFHFHSAEQGKSWGFAICMKGTICENKYLERERLDRISLSDAAEKTQGR